MTDSIRPCAARAFLSALVAAGLSLVLAGCGHLPATESGIAVPAPGAVSGPTAASGPVRNLAAQPGEEIVTLRYWKIRKGTFPEFLEASQKGVWPFFEKIGARIVGMWLVIPDPEGKGQAADYDEVYLLTRYASLEHWSATRNAAALGGDGPDFEALQWGIRVRQSLSLETRVTYMKGETGPLGPVFLPPTGERFEAIDP